MTRLVAGRTETDDEEASLNSGIQIRGETNGGLLRYLES